MKLTPLLSPTHGHQVKDDFIILQKLSTWMFSVAVQVTDNKENFFKESLFPYSSEYTYVFKILYVVCSPNDNRKCPETSVFFSLGGACCGSYMGLTAYKDNNTLGIFLNCSNIHYLLRVRFGSHFSTFSQI
jgi:hypothetical protein